MVRDMRLEIVGAVLELGVLLLRKNAGYGNSAADPLAVFSKLGAVERLGVRMDDKLSRIARGREDGQEDTRGDLAGYLVLDGIVRGMRDGAEPVVWGDVEGLWGKMTEELEDSRRGAEAQREEGEELEGMSKEDREDWEAKAGREEDARKGAEPQREEGEERGERRGGLEVVMGDGELCVRVPVGLWERTLEQAGVAEVWRVEVEELRAELEESRKGAEAQREEGGAGQEEVCQGDVGAALVDAWTLVEDAQVYVRGLEEELEGERRRSWDLAEKLDLARRWTVEAKRQRDALMVELDDAKRDVACAKQLLEEVRVEMVELQEEGKRLEAHGVRLQEELNALVRAHEEWEEDSRKGAEAQREEGKGEEDSRRGAEAQREEGEEEGRGKRRQGDAWPPVISVSDFVERYVLPWRRKVSLGIGAAAVVASLDAGDGWRFDQTGSALCCEHRSGLVLWLWKSARRAEVAYGSRVSMVFTRRESRVIGDAIRRAASRRVADRIRAGEVV